MTIFSLLVLNPHLLLSLPLLILAELAKLVEAALLFVAIFSREFRDQWAGRVS